MSWTTQVPHIIDVALEGGKTKPRLDNPPTRFFWFSGPAFHEGIETHELDGVPSAPTIRKRHSSTAFATATESAWTSCWRPCGSGGRAAAESSTLS